jgi:hypothetical protein
MPDKFQYDVFLSYSAKDKTVVRPLAERLRKDGLKVLFDEWVLKAGDSIPAKIEEGLEHTRAQREGAHAPSRVPTRALAGQSEAFDYQ